MEPIIIGSTQVSPSITTYQSHGSDIWCETLYAGKVLVEHLELNNALSDPIPGLQLLVSLTGGIFYSLGAIKRHQAIRNAPFSQLVLAGTGRALLVTAPTLNFSQQKWDLDKVVPDTSFGPKTFLFPPTDANNLFSVRVVKQEETDPHLHFNPTTCFLIIPLEGEVNLLFDGQRYLLPEDSICVIPPATPHELSVPLGGGSARLLVVDIPHI